MPCSPIISKIRVNNPNKKSSRVHNRNHLIYIATRDGVDISDPVMENLNNSEESSNEVYLKYIHERPGSNGLFGNTDVSDINKLANHIANETAKGKCIYRGILSLSEEDAVRLGYTEKETWINLMNRVMPDIAKELGIPITRLNWCAAIHKEQGHPHCHYMFWDEKDKVKSPYIHSSKQHRIREMISGVINEEEIQQSILDKTLQRDLILDLNKSLLAEEIDSIFNRKEKIPGRISKEDVQRISKGIYTLAHGLPEKGRILYKLLPPNTKEEVDHLVNEIIELPVMRKEYEKYVSTVSNISKAYSASESHEAYTVDMSIKDIKKRLANQILNTCKEVRNISYNFEPQGEPGDYSSTTSDNDAVYDEEIPSYIYNDDEYFGFSTETAGDWKGYWKTLWNNNYKWAIKEIYKNDGNYQRAINVLKNEAAKKNYLAMHDLGKFYAKGIRVEKDAAVSEEYYKGAFKGFEYLARCSDKTEYFSYRLGKMYEAGTGTAPDEEKAVAYYKAGDKNKYAQYSLASMYLRHKGIEIDESNEEMYYTKALELLKSSSDQDNDFASYTLAKNSEKRNVLDLSDGEIKELYLKSASGFEASIKDTESDFLLYRLGTMYYDGKGVDKDIWKAFEYFNRAADMNNANALYAVGKYYADKELDLYDPKQAEEYFLKSIKEGNEYAKVELGLLYIDEESFIYDYQKGIDTFIEASMQGNYRAKYLLASQYVDENSSVYDLRQGVQLLEEVVSQGKDYAAYKLGAIYMKKDTEFYDAQKGVRLLEKAADQENHYAMTKLGSIYLFGSHSPVIEKNIEKGLEYLHRAIEKGNPYAQDVINFYENYRNSMIPSLSYSMLQFVYRTFFQMQQENEVQENMKMYARMKTTHNKNQESESKEHREE